MLGKTAGFAALRAKVRQVSSGAATCAELDIES